MRGLGQGDVEVEVQPEQGGEVLFALHLGDNQAEPCQVIVAAAFGCQSGQLLAEHASELEQAGEDLRVHHAVGRHGQVLHHLETGILAVVEHHRSHAGAALDEPELDEFVHRLAHREPVHVELLRQLDFRRQLVAGFEIAAQDAALEQLEDLVGAGVFGPPNHLAPGRGWHGRVSKKD